MQVALKAYGENGVLAHHLGELEREGLCRVLESERPPGCIEYVEGYDTVLFLFKQPDAESSLADWLKGIDVANSASSNYYVHEIGVVYNGEDLEAVADEVGLSVDEVIKLHAAPTYTVRMMGFSPGFPYLDGLDVRLQLPRRDSPRTRIEPGSIAIGGAHAGIYSVASPGGWHVLGRTDVQLFDTESARGLEPDAQQIFLLSPGDRLRFQPVN